MYLVFDGGYNNGLRIGTWAVVSVEGAKETLLEVGHVNNSSSTEIEWIAAEKAVEYAKKMNVTLIQGDLKACLKAMRKKHPEIEWEWVSSKANIADKYAKYYPELL